MSFPPIPPWPPHDEDIRAALEAAWSDGSWGRYDGPHGRRLAQLLAEMHQLEHVLLCSSGTVAVELALRGLQLESGDEVILAAYDFSGNFRAIESVGARPVLVDIRPDSWCLDPEQLELARGPRTRAVIVSHLHATLADMQRVVEWGRSHGVAVVEDACQVPGALVQGRPAAGWGDVGVLSFGGSKLLSAGRGGAVLTRRGEVFQRMKIHCERGNHAYPLSELQAAVLPPQLAKLAERNRYRSANVRRLLANWPTAVPLRPIVEPDAGNDPSYYKVAFAFTASVWRDRTRSEFLAAAQAEGLPLDAGFRGFVQRSNNRCRSVGNLPYSRRAAEQAVLLHHPILLGASDLMDWLAAALQRVSSMSGQPSG